MTEMETKRRWWPRLRFKVLLLLLIGQFGLAFFSMQKLWFGFNVFFMGTSTWGTGPGGWRSWSLVNPPGFWYQRWEYMGKWGLVFAVSLGTILFLMKDCLDRSKRFED